MFVDKDFPANSSSIISPKLNKANPNNKKGWVKLQWKRPSEFLK